MQIPWISSSLRDTAFVGHPIKNNTGFLAPQSCLGWWLEWLHLVDSVKEKWRRVCVIWCLVWDRGSLGPLCALTDHITISENYSVSKRSHGPAKDGLRVKLGIQWWEAVFRGDLRWWDMKGLSCPVLFFNSQNLESFLKNYIFLLKFSKEFLLTRLVWPHACRAVNCHICNRWLWLMSYPNSYVNMFSASYTTAAAKAHDLQHHLLTLASKDPFLNSHSCVQMLASPLIKTLPSVTG